MKLCIRMCWLTAIAAFVGIAHAQGVAGAKDALTGGLLPIDQAYQLTADVSVPGVIKLHWTIAPHYYLARGEMRFTGGEGVTLGVVQLPDGMKHYDTYLGDVEIYHDSIDVSMPYRLAPGTQRIRFSARYQGCHEVTPKICYPPRVKQFDLPVPGGAAPGAASGISSGHTAGGISGASVSSGPAVTPGTGASGSPSQGSGTGLMVALALALAGGLILNLMPCVPPVLAIKAVTLLESGEDAAGRHRHALAYTAGVLCSFAVIGIVIVALRSAGHALGWGAQLQQPLIVGILVCLMVALGLSMSGVVQFGTSLGNIGHSGESEVRAFPPRTLPGPEYVLREAVRRGFTSNDPTWCNLGQGQPEVGHLPDAPSLTPRLGLEEADCPYGPVAGLEAMREAVASHYNRLYRLDRRSNTRLAMLPSAGEGAWRCLASSPRSGRCVLDIGLPITWRSGD